MSDLDPMSVLDHTLNFSPKLLNESILTLHRILHEVDMKKVSHPQGHWNVVHNLIDGMTMMLSGHLPLGMGHYGHSHSPFEPEQLLDEMGKGKEQERVYSGNGVGVLLHSLVAVRVEVEV